MANAKRTSKKRKTSRKLPIASRFSRNQLLVFVLVFAAVGAVILWRAFAATSTPYAMATNASNLSTASDGPRIVKETVGQKRDSNVVYVHAPVGTTNTAYMKKTFAAGVYKFCVTARPTIAGSTGKLVVANQAYGPNVSVMSGQVFKRSSVTSYDSLACTKVVLNQTTTLYANVVVTYGSFNVGLLTVETQSTSPPPSNSTFYLSPSGSDSNPGTFSAPWRTFSASLPKLRAGNTLYVRGGTYDEYVFATSLSPGSSSARITVANYLGEKPVVRGKFWLAYPSFWTIDGINVTWNPTNTDTHMHMVQLYGGTDWVLQNSELWGAHSYAALLIGDGNKNNLGNFTVRNNCIHDTYASNTFPQDHNVYIDDIGTSPNPHGLLEGNILFNAPGGRGLKLGPPDSGGPKGVTVRYNTIYNSGEYNVSLSKQTHDNQIYRNILVKAGGGANIGTYELTGTNNVAKDNVGFAALKLLGPGLVDGGGNLSVDPQFEEISCNGLQPQNSQAQAYGKYAL